MRSPAAKSGVTGKTNETHIFWKDKDGNLHSMVTAGDYNRLRGVGMNHAEYNSKEILRDLKQFREYGVTGAIMTALPKTRVGSSIRQDPPYYYDSETGRIYGPPR